ncbi:SixA phosphatase family protein [Dinoroseobacter sp. S375]|uniref:SixA phosphatase family protein n=1 Tax=Dinoroseobacter sp. S375 TaxID=3415136 RepID=UPI003C7A0B8D
MKTLLLLRHAKSSWAEPGRDDHSRPLNGRGRRGAEALGRWITEEGLTPDEVLCSDATRTQETWRRLGLDGEATLRPTLYHAGPAMLMQTVQEATGAQVLVIAHNPGIAEFAGQMARVAPDHHRFAQYPTCALTVLQFEIDDWAALAPGTGEVRAFVIPADLGVTRT